MRRARATRLRLFVAAGALTLAAGAFAGTQSADELDPIRVAPETHKVAFENAIVRVLEVRVPAGKIEPRHRHPYGLSVYLTDWTAKSTAESGVSQVNQRKAGTFSWSEAIVHSVQNVGTTEGHVLRIELKR